jgi:predicted acyl esterase
VLSYTSEPFSEQRDIIGAMAAQLYVSSTAAYRSAKGHRLRVQKSSGAFPRWARNLGGSEPFARATQLHRAKQSIHHSPTYPSAVIVPFCNPSPR